MLYFQGDKRQLSFSYALVFQRSVRQLFLLMRCSLPFEPQMQQLGNCFHAALKTLFDSPSASLKPQHCTRL
jgi:hypothetical protein